MSAALLFAIAQRGQVSGEEADKAAVTAVHEFHFLDGITEFIAAVTTRDDGYAIGHWVKCLGQRIGWPRPTCRNSPSTVTGIAGNTRFARD